MFKTDAEYFSDTSHISSSMMKAYLRSPAYYKALYVTREIERPETPALHFGSALDCLLTEGQDAFEERFSYNVLKRDDPERFEDNKTSSKVLLSQSAWDAVHRSADAIRKTTAYHWLLQGDTTPQVTLTGTLHGQKIKGKLDWLTVEGDVAYITDLKTTTNLHPTKYFYHSLDYNYPLQMRVYQHLVEQNYDVQIVVARHLVVTKNDWPQVKTFNFSPALLTYQDPLIERAVLGIAGQEFDEADMTWDDAFLLTHKDDEYETLSTSEGDSGAES